MEKPLITVCITNYNSFDFVSLNLFALKKLTKNSYKVIIRDNNSRISDYQKLENLIKEKYNNVYLYRVETKLLGSVAHGEALNDLVSQIDTEYGVILDADAVFLKKNWDEILISKMNDQMPIYGTQADSNGKKPMDFPLMFAIIFKTDILKSLNIDFRPRDLSKHEDTGFELREKYLSNNFSGGLLYDFNTRTFKKGLFADIVCSEYYLSKEEPRKIFASHFGRGSAPSAKKLVRAGSNDGIFIKFLNKILLGFNFIKWKKDRKDWINKSKIIINNNV